MGPEQLRVQCTAARGYLDLLRGGRRSVRCKRRDENGNGYERRNQAHRSA
jgi:hypothetical protein